MLKLILISAILAIAGPTTAPSNSAPSTQPANKMCAVNTDEAIDPSVTTVYKDKTIGFCCKDCIPKFKANPERYMKTLK